MRRLTSVLLSLFVAAGVSACTARQSVQPSVTGFGSPATANRASDERPGVTTNLIKDGSLEKPVAPNGGFLVFNTGQTFSKWTVVGASGSVGIVSGTFSQNGFTFPAGCAKQWLDLTGLSQTPTGIAQTVATQSGKSYTLKFSIGNVVDPHGIFGTTSTIDVLVNGVQVFSATNSRGAGMTKQVWKSFSTTITANSTSTTIAFLNADPSTDTNDGIDCISLH